MVFFIFKKMALSLGGIFFFSLCVAYAAEGISIQDLLNEAPQVVVKNSGSSIPQHGEKEMLKKISVSIEDAVFSAVQHNRELMLQKVEPIRKGTFEMVEKASFDPEVFAELSYVRESDFDPSETDEDMLSNEKTTLSTIGIRKAFSTGTTIETAFSHERTREDGTPEAEKATIDVSLTQSILNGFGTTVNLVRVKQTALDTRMSREELKGFVQTLVANTEMAYWEYVLSKQKIVIFEKSLDVTRKQRDEIKQQIDVGVLPETEAAYAESEVALREQELIDARSFEQKKQLQLIYLILPDNMFGFDLEISPISRPDIDVVPVTDISDRIALAEKYRPDLEEARILLERNALETIVTKNGTLPRLDFFIQLGRIGYADNFSDTFKHFDEEDATDLEVGFTFSHAIKNRKARATDREAMVSRAQAEMAVENLKKRIQLDVRLAINEVTRTGKQIHATRVTRVSQEKVFFSEKEKFAVGASTALLVAQAYRDLMAARISEVEAIVNYRIARVNLFLTEGSLLDIRGIMINFE